MNMYLRLLEDAARIRIEYAFQALIEPPLRIQQNRDCVVFVLVEHACSLPCRR